MEHTKIKPLEKYYVVFCWGNLGQEIRSANSRTNETLELAYKRRDEMQALQSDFLTRYAVRMERE